MSDTTVSAAPAAAPPPPVLADYPAPTHTAEDSENTPQNVEDLLQGLCFHMLRSPKVLQFVSEAIEPEQVDRFCYLEYQLVFRIAISYFQQHAACPPSGELDRMLRVLEEGSFDYIRDAVPAARELVEHSLNLPEDELQPDEWVIERCGHPYCHYVILSKLKTLLNVGGVGHRASFAIALEENATFALESAEDLQRIKDCGRNAATAPTIPPIDLQPIYDNAPGLVRKIADSLNTGCSDKLASLHILAAYSFAGSCLGKHLVGQNMGREYYPANWLVGLAPTGTNKAFPGKLRMAAKSAVSAHAHTAARPVECKPIRLPGYNPADACTTHTLPDQLTYNGLFQMIGSKLSPAQLTKMLPSERRQRVAQIFDGHRLSSGYVWLNDEVTQSIGKLLTNTGSGNTAEMASVLKLADSGSTAEKSVGEHGWMGVDDVCVGIVGASQPPVWAEAMQSIEGDKTGLLGRFLVVAAEDTLPLRLDPTVTDRARADDELKAATYEIMARAVVGKEYAFAQRNAKLAVNFTDPAGYTDWAGEYYAEAVAEMGEEYKYLCDKFGFENELGLKGKTFWHACKMTMVEQFLKLQPADIVNMRKRPSTLPAYTESWYANAKREDDEALAVHMAAYEARCCRIPADDLLDVDTFKRWVKIVVRIFGHALRRADYNPEYSENMLRVGRVLMKHDGRATRTDFNHASIRVVGHNGQKRKITAKELDELLQGLIDLGCICKDDSGRVTTYTLLDSDFEKRLKAD